MGRTDTAVVDRDGMDDAGEAEGAVADPRALLWPCLDRPDAPYRFRRDYPVGPFFADFACFTARLVVEVAPTEAPDAARAAYEAKRGEAYRQAGFEVVRAPEADIRADAGAVCAGIWDACNRRIVRPRQAR